MKRPSHVRVYPHVVPFHRFTQDDKKMLIETEVLFQEDNRSFAGTLWPEDATPPYIKSREDFIR